jgi:hypothetical protein
MLDFISSRNKKYIAGISAILLGALQFSTLAKFLALFSGYTMILGGIVILGGIWVLMSETE